MSQLHHEFADRRPDAVLRRGSEMFIDAIAAVELIDLAVERDVRVLGLEGFLVSDDGVYPALSRIADYSSAERGNGARAARELLKGPWSATPTSADQMHQDATGRHMVVVVLDQS